VKDAVAIYTDVWASMGQESESAKRKTDFAAYQVNAALVRHAPHAYFMHCLPAHRGEEVTDDVIDGPTSIVVGQAANRLHVQKGILAWLLSRV
jgi:ornithine carbamoyltransferase